MVPRLCPDTPFTPSHSITACDQISLSYQDIAILGLEGLVVVAEAGLVLAQLKDADLVLLGVIVRLERLVRGSIAQARHGGGSTDAPTTTQ